MGLWYVSARTSTESSCLVDYFGYVLGKLRYADRTYQEDPEESYTNMTAELKFTDTSGVFRQVYKGPSK